jgi:anti-sigma regulatory factor (Ser/Thr protein kinase)
MTYRFRFPAGDGALAAEARRVATKVAVEQGLDETAAGKVALVVTEAVTNLVKHGGGGELLVGATADDEVTVLALDRGPGMANLAECLRDGFSTSGTAGTGLGAIARQAARFDIHSLPGVGTAVVAGVRKPRHAPPVSRFDTGGVSVPAPGESLCGDAWVAAPVVDGLKVMVVDGLGHGPLASEAAQHAVAAFQPAAGRPVDQIIDAVHGALRSTRGAAVGVAAIDTRRRVVTFAGVGNIQGSIVAADGPARSVVSHGGIAGQGKPRVQVFSYPWPEGAMLVMTSDGVTSHWTLNAYPGLWQRDPFLIAGVLYRDFVRGRDDATVVVARERAA